MDLFSLQGKNAVVLGGSGVLGSAMAKGLAEAGANIIVCGRSTEKSQDIVNDLKELPVKACAYKLDARNSGDLERVRAEILRDFGEIDILVNAVGGNSKEATTSEDQSFFELPGASLEKVFSLNIMGGAILPSQVFGKAMAESENGGVIINISSMSAYQPLTRVPVYSAAKAAVSNFTQWLAVDLAKLYGEKIRVNALAPGFFLSEQNRFLLTNPGDGSLTKRGKAIVEHTPMARFGKPEELVGTLVWLCSDASKFVTGVVVPVDGGFSAFAGV